MRMKIFSIVRYRVANLLYYACSRKKTMNLKGWLDLIYFEYGNGVHPDVCPIDSDRDDYRPQIMVILKAAY